MSQAYNVVQPSLDNSYLRVQRAKAQIRALVRMHKRFAINPDSIAVEPHSQPVDMVPKPGGGFGGPFALESAANILGFAFGTPKFILPPPPKLRAGEWDPFSRAVGRRGRGMRAGCRTLDTRLPRVATVAQFESQPVRQATPLRPSWSAAKPSGYGLGAGLHLFGGHALEPFGAEMKMPSASAQRQSPTWRV